MADTRHKIKLIRGDALIVVDVQNDFLTDGALAVPHGDEVVPVLNRYCARFSGRGLAIIASRDWHPPDHCSFDIRGGAWPVHCVAGTRGAEFAPVLQLPAGTIVIDKATDPHKDAYSAFEETGLEQRLREAGIGRLFVGGLATDYCVLNTVRDAVALGFEIYVLRDAIRAVDVRAGDGARAETEMHVLGARMISLNDMTQYSDAA